MTNKYWLMCMSFDGGYVREGEFNTIDDVWNYSNDMGSRWWFYPFHFVVRGQTIVDVPDDIFGWCSRRKIKTVIKIFNEFSQRDDTQGMDCDDFAWYLYDRITFTNGRLIIDKN